MPPALPDPKQPQPDALTSFFASDSVGGALKASGFDVHEEMETLIRHFRDTDPNVSLRAHARLRHVLREVAQASGLIQRQSAEAIETHEGRKVKVSFETSKLVARINQEPINAIVNQDHPEFASTYLPAATDASPHAGGSAGGGSSSPDPGNGRDADGAGGRPDPVRHRDHGSDDLGGESRDPGDDPEEDDLE